MLQGERSPNQEDLLKFKAWLECDGGKMKIVFELGNGPWHFIAT
jgi:hypothetical protein